MIAWVGALQAQELPRSGGHPDAVHEEMYDQECCNKADCEPVPNTAIRESAKGYEVEYISPKFGLVKGLIAYGREKLSHGCIDGMCQHACAHRRWETIPGCKSSGIYGGSCSRESTTLPADVGCIYVNQMW